VHFSKNFFPWKSFATSLCVMTPQYFAPPFWLTYTTLSGVFFFCLSVLTSFSHSSWLLPLLEPTYVGQLSSTSLYSARAYPEHGVFEQRCVLDIALLDTPVDVVAAVVRVGVTRLSRFERRLSGLGFGIGYVDFEGLDA
jgi:hypothetical protein